MQPHALVVDDAKSVQKILEVLLSRIGFAVTVADDALAGLAVMRSALHPLVVLLDDGLPPAGSAALLTAGLADPWIGGRHAFILMYTLPPGLPEPGPRAERIAQALPRPPLLVRKPFSVGEMIKAIQQAERDLSSQP